jgi:glyoxylase-like metal-dependent hydrolase (beta-lactamase superfamily II)
MPLLCLLSTVALLATLLPPTVAGQQSGTSDDAPNASITLIRGDLYRAQYGRDHTVFLVTSEGILLADPLNIRAARWLRDELAGRFPGRAVRYVIPSHHRFDRASGGDAFRPAVIVVNDAFNAARRDAASVRTATIDDDRRPIYDRNHDGTVTGIELYSDVPPPTRTYGTQTTIQLGGKTIQLLHPSPAFEPDMTTIYFRDERVVFAADYLPLDSLPRSIAPTTPRALRQWLDAVAMLDFDMLLSGHGDADTKAEVVALQQYVDALTDGVRTAVARGRTVEETRNELPLDAHASLGNFPARRAANIDEVYRRTTPEFVLVRATPSLGFIMTDSVCTHSHRTSGPGTEVTCEGTGGFAPGAEVGMTWLNGRYGVDVAVSAAAPVSGWWRERYDFRTAGPVFNPGSASLTTDEFTFVHEQRMFAVSGTYTLSRTPRAAFDVSGGPVFFLGRTDWTRVDPRGRTGPGPVFERTELRQSGTESWKRRGLTFGLRATLAPRRRMSLLLPFEMTYTGHPPVVNNGSLFQGMQLGSWTMKAGAGLQWAASRSAH